MFLETQTSITGHVRSFPLALEMEDKRSKRELTAGSVRTYWT
jgi:hypothetical protein